MTHGRFKEVIAHIRTLILTFSLREKELLRRASRLRDQRLLNHSFP